ncbi:hypothetical protein [Bacillus sp. AK128]
MSKAIDVVENIEVYSFTNKLVLGAILASLAALFQSAGIIVGIGYALSILTTWPIAIATVISVKIGIMSYFSTILLLVLIQPSELLIFPFTTGLLGLSLGVGIKIVKNSLLSTLFASLSLTFGILTLLYAVQFPILGPTISTTFDFKVVVLTFLFSILYSWLWLRLCSVGLRFLYRFTTRSKVMSS